MKHASEPPFCAGCRHRNACHCHRVAHIARACAQLHAGLLSEPLKIGLRPFHHATRARGQHDGAGTGLDERLGGDDAEAAEATGDEGGAAAIL